VTKAPVQIVVRGFGLADPLPFFGHKKTGALADAPVFSIIGCDLFPTSLIIAFFLWYYPDYLHTQNALRHCILPLFLNAFLQHFHR
jgi:hypothetical protein